MSRSHVNVLAALCALVIGAGCAAEEAGPPTRTPAPVRVATVGAREFAEELIALGTLVARESVDITASVTEKVSRIHFEDGQAVREGQVLVELVRAEELSRLDQARAELTHAEGELKRVEKLAASNIATASELDTQRTRVESNRATLKTIEAQLGDRLVRAPFDGIVGLRRVSPGSLVTPSTVITTLDAVSILLADLPLPERFLGQIGTGQSVKLASDAFAGEVFEGEVSAIAGRVDPDTRAITVRARVQNPDGRLRPGMLVRAVLAVGTRTSPAVPEHALVQQASRAYVYAIDSEDTAKVVDVTIGRRQPGWVEIVQGLQGGEQVVIDGLNRVSPGGKVALADATARAAE